MPWGQHKYVVQRSRLNTAFQRYVTTGCYRELPEVIADVLGCIMLRADKPTVCTARLASKALRAAGALAVQRLTIDQDIMEALIDGGSGTPKNFQHVRILRLKLPSMLLATFLGLAVLPLGPLLDEGAAEGEATGEEFLSRLTALEFLPDPNTSNFAFCALMSKCPRLEVLHTLGPWPQELCQSLLSLSQLSSLTLEFFPSGNRE